MVSWIDKVSYYRRKGVPNRPASLSFTNWDEIDWDEKKPRKIALIRRANQESTLAETKITDFTA